MARWRRGGGTNYYGELDVPEGNDFVDIAVGFDSSFALRRDGSIAAWGDNTYRMLDVPEGNDFAAIAVDETIQLALRKDGSILNFTPICVPPRAGCFQPEGNDFVAVDAYMALRADGSVVVRSGWGAPPPPGNDYVAIAAGARHMFMLRSDGSIAAWPPGPPDDILLDVPEGNDFSAITAGRYFGLALRNDGSLAGWGVNHYGQIDVPAGNGFVAVDAGRWYGIAIEVPEPGVLGGCLAAAITALVLAACARCRRCAVGDENAR